MILPKQQQVELERVAETLLLGGEETRFFSSGYRHLEWLEEKGLVDRDLKDGMLSWRLTLLGVAYYRKTTRGG